jgi:Lon protease-like protein
MTDDSLAFSPDDFSGFARLFPLPNLVMFPHVMQAMHIFEPRYRSLFEEAISDDKLIALGVLSQGWEVDYEGRPALESMACLCRIATYQRTPEGTYNVLLLGVRRIQLQEEMPPTKPFRVAEAKIVEDHVPSHPSAEEIVGLQQQLLMAFKRSMPKIPTSYEQIDELLGSQITLGMLADIVAYTAELNVSTKLSLLKTSNVIDRVHVLLNALSQSGQSKTARRTFPPAFSTN